jgi:ADP-heptose:LPS heptosyltransferase
VDSHSTDQTVDFAGSYPKVRVIDADWHGFSANKRLAVEQCTHDWILWLDADEEVTYDLQQEILSLPEDFHLHYDAFTIPRKTFFMGEYARIFYPSRSGRLFHKHRCGFNNKIVHEGLLIHDKNRLGHLRECLNHFSYDTLEHFFRKMHFYGRYGGEELLNKKKIMGKWRLVLSPLYTFFKYYIIAGGFLDRRFGLIVSLGSSYANFIKYTHYYFLLGQKKSEALRNELAHKTIILSRTDNIGDVMLTIPLASILREKIPGIQIVFLGRRYTSAVLKASGFIDRFVAVEDILEGQLSLETLQAQAIVFAYPDRKLASLAKHAGIPIRVGTSHRWYNLLYCNHTVNLGRRHSDLHEAQLNLQLLEPLGIGSSYSPYQLEHRYALKSHAVLPQQLQSLLDTNRFVLLMHPKSKGSAREWPSASYASLSKQLLPEQYQVIVTGTAEEGQRLTEEGFWSACGEHVFNATGMLSLDQLLALIQQSDGLLACSTGPLHMASAVGIHALGLYPPMRPIHAGRWAPIGPNADYLSLSKECSDCRKNMDCHCLRSITVEEVYLHLNHWKKLHAHRIPA